MSKKVAVIGVTILLIFSSIIVVVTNKIDYKNNLGDKLSNIKVKKIESCLENLLNMEECLTNLNFNENDVQIIKSYFEENIAKRSQCHYKSHLVGEYLGENNLVTKMPVYYCQGGILHGYFKKLNLGLDKYLAKAIGICGNLKKIESVEYYDCYHGIGHGLVKYYSKNTGFKELVKICRDLKSGRESSNFCESGLFSEGSSVSLLKREIVNDIYISKCNFNNIYSKECMRRLPVFLFNNSTKIDEIKKFCESIKNPDCYYGIGWLTAEYSSIDKCSIFQERYIRSCIEGGLMKIIGELKIEEKNINLCKNFNESVRFFCEERKNTIYNWEKSL